MGTGRTTNFGEIKNGYKIQAKEGIMIICSSLEQLHKYNVMYLIFQFVAHPNVQQLLASIWYDGLPGFRRKSMVKQLLEVIKLGSFFPIYSLIYMIAPNSPKALFIKKPFVKFILHSSSYIFFLSKLTLNHNPQGEFSYTGKLNFSAPWYGLPESGIPAA